MVLVEELDDEEASEPVSGLPSAATKTKLKKGFLQNNAEPLYPPEGSSEGYISPETHKAHTEHHINEDINKGMNRGAKDNNGYERPPWYSSEWPKDCQYNSPGCNLNDMDSSSHPSDMHKNLVRDHTRWSEALANGVTCMRFSFMQLTDEDLKEVIENLKGNEHVTELDLTHNKIHDAGVQALVAALSAGAAPNLKELRIYKNSFGELGKVMLTQGLAVFRKKLDIRAEEPDWTKLAQKFQASAPAENAPETFAPAAKEPASVPPTVSELEPSGTDGLD